MVPVVQPSAATPERTAAPAPPSVNGSAPKRKVTASDEALVLDLTTELNRALDGGDVDEWTALMDLDDDGVAQQQDWYTAVQAVPMDLRRMVAVDLDAGDGDALNVEMAFQHQVTGIDVTPALEYYSFTMTGQGADLRISEISGDGTQQSAYPQLWDLGPVDVVESDSVVVLTEAGGAEFAEDMMPSLDEAATATMARFPGAPVDRVMVTFALPEEVGTLFGGEGDDLGFTGVTVPTVASEPEVNDELHNDDGVQTDFGDPFSWDRSAVRIVLDVEYLDIEAFVFEGITGGSPLMRHEMTHWAMASTVEERWSPQWAAEGLAGWWELAGDEVVRLDAYDRSYVIDEETGLEPAWPPDDYDDFYPDDVDAIDRHYSDSALIFTFLEDEFGADATVAIGTELHQLTAFEHAADIDTVLQEQTGTPLSEIQAEWATWIADLPEP